MLAADLPPFSCIVVPATLLVAFGDDRGDREASPSCVDSHKCQVGGTDMLAIVMQIVLDEDFYANLHRTMENAIYRRFQDHQIPDMYRHQKIEVINRRRDDISAGMTMRCHSSRKVDPVHQASAKQRAERVGVVGKNNLSHLGLRIAHR